MIVSALRLVLAYQGCLGQQGPRQSLQAGIITGLGSSFSSTIFTQKQQHHQHHAFLTPGVSGRSSYPCTRRTPRSVALSIPLHVPKANKPKGYGYRYGGSSFLPLPPSVSTSAVPSGTSPSAASTGFASGYPVSPTLPVGLSSAPFGNSSLSSTALPTAVSDPRKTASGTVAAIGPTSAPYGNSSLSSTPLSTGGLSGSGVVPSTTPSTDPTSNSAPYGNSTTTSLGGTAYSSGSVVYSYSYPTGTAPTGSVNSSTTTTITSTPTVTISGDPSPSSNATSIVGKRGLTPGYPSNTTDPGFLPTGPTGPTGSSFIPTGVPSTGFSFIPTGVPSTGFSFIPTGVPSTLGTSIKFTYSAPRSVPPEYYYHHKKPKRSNNKVGHS